MAIMKSLQEQHRKRNQKGVSLSEGIHEKEAKKKIIIMNRIM